MAGFDERPAMITTEELELPAAPVRARRKFAPVVAPDISKLPDDAVLTRKQMIALSGFKESAFKKWAREQRGPTITTVEGLPRYRVADARIWLGAA
jgi:hypothetical protein